jgi:hypothetical protein
MGLLRLIRKFQRQVRWTLVHFLLILQNAACLLENLIVKGSGIFQYAAGKEEKRVGPILCLEGRINTKLWLQRES